MRKFAKTLNTKAELIFDYNNTTGGVATPDTSIKVTVYEGNADTKVVTAQDMAVKDSLTGLYTYVWDITSVTNGFYNAVYTAVSGGLSFIDTEQVVITDKSVDSL